MIRKRKKTLALICTTSLVASAFGGLTAFAEQSPTWAYSAEEWATLRDDNLDYSEIDKLVHEYNPTVLANVLSYQDQMDKTSSDVAQSYYDAAEKITSSMSYPDEDSANYGSGVTSYLNSQISAENLREQGDKNTNDSTTYKLSYDKQEATLAKQAKQLMVTYWSSYYNLDTLRNNITLAEQNLATVQRKVAAGTATSSQQLTAEQSLTDAQTALTTAETNLEATRRSLVLMLGWSASDTVNIGELPTITADTVNAIDLNADIETSKTNNYSLQSTERQLNNATTSNVRAELTQTRDTAVKNIAADVTDLYDSLKQSLTDLDAANETLAVKQSDLTAADAKLAAGMMTQNQYNSTKISYEAAQTSVKQKQLAVLTAYINYEAAVNGLAEN